MSQNNKGIKLAYKSFKHSKGPDVELVCPKCGCNLWEIHDKTGTGKLPRVQAKLKCSECGQWFICNRDHLFKQMGM